MAGKPFRILRYRWRTVLFITLLTVATAVWATNLRNDSIEPTFEATASVTFVSDVDGLELLGEQLLESVETQLEDARLAAIEVNEEFLTRPGFNITADPALGRLTFVATGSTAEEAEANVEEMRQRLVGLDPFDIEGELTRQIESTLAKLDAVRAEINALVQATSADPEIEDRRRQLQALLTDLEGRELTLERDIRVPPTGEDAPSQSELQAELRQVQSAIIDVETELASLPRTLDPLSPEATQLRVLQGQYDALEARYQSLLIERTDLEGLPLLGVIETIEETPTEVPVEIAAAVAFVIGLGLSLGVLALSERLVGPVWTASDAAPVHFLPSVVTRPRGGVAWYLKSGTSKRKSAIQLMRSTIRARAKGDELVLAVVRSGVGAHDSHTLGVDLASAFASTSVQTALIDASFDSAWRQPEFRHHAFSLQEVVDSDEEAVNALVDSAPGDGAIQDDLMIISAGEPGVAVDVLAGPAVSHLIDVLRETRDVVVVLCDELGAATTQAVLDRCDMVLVATRPGVTTRAALLDLHDEMSYRDIDLVGAFVLTSLLSYLRHPGDHLREWLHRVRRQRLEAEPAAPQIRPQTQPAPVPAPEVASAQGALVDEETSVEELLGGEAQVPPEEEPEVPAAAVRAERPALVAVPSEEPPSKPLLPRMDAMYDLLKSESPEAVVSDAEQFVVSWVTALVLADGNAGLDPATVTAVEEAGFIPLSTWKGHPSLGSRLRNEFRNELGRADATKFEELLLKALSAGDEGGSATSIDRWVDRRYFPLHAENENWEPTVWHITSRLGTISALVAAERFERERMETFVDSVVIRAIERLARRRRRKEVVGDETAVAQLDEQMEDARHLGLAIAWLLDGSRPESRIWYPSLDEGEQPTGWQPRWDQGIKSNLAPLQRLGIISFPVLTERELSALEPAG
ncbi:MAG TPA: hypothetical protein VK011_08175 [Acidimicrobiia bacterium]|nr:hypothetical protein [Acidimicrobiia bacterium]